MFGVSERTTIAMRSSWPARRGSTFALQLTPASRTVVGNDVPEHFGECGRVDGFTLADGHGASSLVLVTCGDNPLRIGDYGAVVEEYVYVVLGRKQRAYVALQHEVRTVGALDGLANLAAGGVHQ